MEESKIKKIKKQNFSIGTNKIKPYSQSIKQGVPKDTPNKSIPPTKKDK